MAMLTSATAVKSHIPVPSSMVCCWEDAVAQNLSVLLLPCSRMHSASSRCRHGRRNRHLVCSTRADSAPSEEQQATLSWGPTARDTSFPPPPHYTSPKREVISSTPISGLWGKSTSNLPTAEESDEEAMELSIITSAFLLEPELAFEQLDMVLLKSQGKIDKIVQSNMKGIDKISAQMDVTQRSMDVVRGKIEEIIKTATPKIRKIRTKAVAREEMREKLKKVTNVFTDPVREEVVPEPEEAETDGTGWSVSQVFAKWFGSIVLALALGGSAAPLLAPPDAIAFELTFEGPRGWLKEQKRKNSSFLLAPIANSKARMDQVRILFDGEASLDELQYTRAQELVRAASLDCMPFAPGSVAEFQAKAGIQPCTFKLIAKNAASLLPKDDPQRLDANAKLMSLIDSFVQLDSLLSQELLRSGKAAKTIPSAVLETQTALDTFEAGIKSVLGVTPPSS